MRMIRGGRVGVGSKEGKGGGEARRGEAGSMVGEVWSESMRGSGNGEMEENIYSIRY